jgi:phasin family protein
MQPTQMQTQFFEMYRHGLKTTADMMAASLEGAQRLQQQQLDALHTALEDQVKSARELSEVRTMDELAALQTRLTGAQLERAVDFWSRMWRAASDNQVAIIGRAQSQLGQARDAVQQVQQASHRQERKSA